MPLYMKYGDIDGKVETAGYEKWIELASFQWGVGRSIASPIGKSADREAAHPSVSEVAITKLMDISTNKLLEQALGGNLDTKVEIKYTSLDMNLDASPASTIYDLARQKLNG